MSKPDHETDESAETTQSTTGRRVDPEVLRAAGRKGGLKVSQNRAHMAEIGRRGGKAVANNRDHMSAIGRRGGEAVSGNREHMAAIGHKGGEAVRSKYGPEFYSEIGRKGGERVSRNRDHMAEIGRKGGESRLRGDEPVPEGAGGNGLSGRAKTLRATGEEAATGGDTP
ncbi:MAG TPA: KGG domain-containing protein [Candidatus Thermoplasmatota archaeon]|nr:KGG domain-containing protein [Candidatus Thermoplasmatota archaeon]